MKRVSSKLLSVVIASALTVTMLPISAFGSLTDPNLQLDADVSEEVPPSSIEDELGGPSDDASFGSDQDEDVVLDEVSDVTDDSIDDSVNGAEEDLNQAEVELAVREVAAPVDNLTAFVTRLYTVVLNRGPEESGLQVHVEALRSGAYAADTVWGFFDSAEFARRGLSNEQKVETAYRAMFDRAADPSGKANWTGKLDAGMSMRAVIAGFCDSPEFKALCARWGVVPGTLTVVENRDKNQNVTAFVQRLYQKVLGRGADTGGLNAHTGYLAAGGNAADLIWVFFGSPEFSSKPLSNASKVDAAYAAMLDRAADPSGKANWTGKLDTGMSMRAVIAGFCGSPEFKALCARWGVVPGTLAVVENRDKNQNVTAFVQRLYQKVLGRGADPEGLNSQTGAILSSGSTAAVVWGLLASAEYEAKNPTNAQKIEMAYQAMFDRSADPSGMSTYKAMLDNGMSIRAVVASFSNSPEYRALCSKWGVLPGKLGVTEARDRNQNATIFVQRLYQKVLGRSGDASGLNTHTGYLFSGGDASSLAWSFFNSSEFANRGLSNEEKVNVAYRAMLDRDPDPTGKADWLSKLNNGMSLQSLVYGFAGSNEFRKLCQSYGIDPDRYWNMDSRASGLSSRTGWLIAVDTNKCLVSVYNGNKGNWNAVNRFSCAPGKASTPSRKGVFTVGIKGYVFGSGYSCYYYTQYSGDYLFHSVLYDPGTFSVQDGTMGRPVSHGCIRLWIENAKYIYDRVPSGSTVVVF